MRLEPFVALPLIGAFHFLNRVANEWSWRFELPAAGRAHPTLKTFFFQPIPTLAGHIMAGFYTHIGALAGPIQARLPSTWAGPTVLLVLTVVIESTNSERGWAI